jgi:cytochrome c oxidase assembly protein subunit 15
MATTTVIGRRTGTPAVAKFAWVVVGYFIFVVLLGAVVRATDSGGGCGASWPLCNGDFFPHHPRLATVIEFTHRSTSGVCTVLLIAQGIHFTNTLLLMAALTLTAWFLRDDPPDRSGSRVSKLAACLAVASTILVGATGALAALADTLFPSPTLAAGFAQDFAAHAPILVRMRWLHPAAAVLGFVCVVLLLRAQRPWDRVAMTVASLLALQFVLGVADVLLLAPTWLQIVHLLGADLYWVALVVLAGRVLWSAERGTLV